MARHSPYRHLGPARETVVNSDTVARSKMGLGLSDVLLMTTFCLVACKESESIYLLSQYKPVYKEICLTEHIDDVNSDV